MAPIEPGAESPESGSTVPHFFALIPARRASTRLPDKPLADICGRPMVVRVAERAAQSGAAEVCVATDDEEIAAVCRRFGYRALLTRADHATGTDRLAEAAAQLGLAPEAIVVNVQGDEPLIPPTLIARCASELAQAPDCAMATASHAIVAGSSIFDANVVKVVTDARRRALYFSRAPIPWERDAFANDRRPAVVAGQRHIGIYAYRASFLATFPALAQAPIEAAEALEQLRALWHGYKIVVFEAADAPAGGVDTAGDLERVRAVFSATN